MIVRITGIVLAASAVVSGCSGRTEAPTYSVTGTVTLDGQPMAEGEIYFITKATGQLDVVLVKEGRFEGQVKGGQRRVEIRAYRMETPEAPADMPGLQLEPTRVNYLPAKYNTETALSADVAEDKPNEFAFEVTSQ